MTHYQLHTNLDFLHRQARAALGAARLCVGFAREARQEGDAEEGHYQLAAAMQHRQQALRFVRRYDSMLKTGRC